MADTDLTIQVLEEIDLTTPAWEAQDHILHQGQVLAQDPQAREWAVLQGWADQVPHVLVAVEEDISDIVDKNNKGRTSPTFFSLLTLP